MDVDLGAIWKNLAKSGSSVTILIFVATQLLTYFSDNIKSRTHHRRLVRALFCEVLYNSKGLFAYPPVPLASALAKMAADPKFRPHVIYAVHTKFYDGSVAGILAFDGETVGLLLDFLRKPRISQG